MGPTVTLDLTTPRRPTFTAPQVGSAGATLTFELVVSDGNLSATSQAEVIVQNVNHPPVARTAPGLTVYENRPVTLSGVSSSDPDGDALTYSWSQVGGSPIVTLSDLHAAAPGFTAPLVSAGGADLVFQLIVHDGVVSSRPELMTVHVRNVDDPPQCQFAYPKPPRLPSTASSRLDVLWPPNHKMIDLAVGGVTDPGATTVTVTVVGVTQDEPTAGLGEGDTPTDAIIQGNEVLLRAERAGTGNGRVYAITFRAENDFGETCTGTVSVCVPRAARGACVDDGQVYRSTAP